ncbi:MAG: MerR family transcriptional regulator [Muribaculaceae bacterium]|nr:MerR family transcriptional regulator [Muribaculaceae bacterium]
MTTAKSIYSPREVCDMLGISKPTLRYWSSIFPQINPKLTPSGHRRYTQKDIDTCRDIMFLLRDKGLSIEYAQKEMDRQRKYPPRQPRKCRNPEEAIALLDEVREATEDPHMVSAIDSVIKYLNNLSDVERSSN